MPQPLRAPGPADVPCRRPGGHRQADRGVTRHRVADPRAEHRAAGGGVRHPASGRARRGREQRHRRPRDRPADAWPIPTGRGAVSAAARSSCRPTRSSPRPPRSSTPAASPASPTSIRRPSRCRRPRSSPSSTTPAPGVVIVHIGGFVSPDTATLADLCRARGHVAPRGRRPRPRRRLRRPPGRFHRRRRCLLLLSDQGHHQRRGRHDHHRRRDAPRRGPDLPRPGQGRLPRRRPRPARLRLADERTPRRRRPRPAGPPRRVHRRPPPDRPPLRRGAGRPARHHARCWPPKAANRTTTSTSPSSTRESTGRPSSRLLREEHRVGMSGEVYSSPLHRQPIFADLPAGPLPVSAKTSAPATSACRSTTTWPTPKPTRCWTACAKPSRQPSDNGMRGRFRGTAFSFSARFRAVSGPHPCQEARDLRSADCRVQSGESGTQVRVISQRVQRVLRSISRAQTGVSGRQASSSARRSASLALKTRA